MKLWRHPKESEENRLILHQIIEKWLRLVTGMSADFSDEANEGMEDAAKVKAAYLASINRSRNNRCMCMPFLSYYSYQRAGRTLCICNDAKVSV